MKSRLLLCGLPALVLVSGCHPIHPLAGTPTWQPDSAHATQLTNEEFNGNGIEVDAPKVYDDASLRMMLDATRAKLAAMSGLNQDALISRLGSVSGATVDQSQFGLQVTASPLPATATNTGATNSVTTNGSLPQGNTTIPGTVTVTTDPTQSTVTTSSAAPATPVVSPGIAFTPPTGVSPSSLDVLNEQMQLSYEMTNLELLLEGALSDRFVTNQRFVKPRVTLGFPISLRAPIEFKDSEAVVEVEVKTSPQNLSDTAVPEPPAITALLPREKTYNVAAMTDHMTSIGGGAVIGAIGVSASYLKGHKTYYLVQDQDTVAMQRPHSADINATSFLWEFRPVLGQHFVRGGMKQTFVQLALPILENASCLGSVRIRTYWRRFDQKNGVAREVIPDSVLVSTRTFPISQFDLAPDVGNIDYQDLGDGTVMVKVSGKYLAGTYIQLGPMRYDAGRNLQIEESDAKFIAPIAALARWTGHIVARSGDASDLLNLAAQKRLPRLDQASCADPMPPKVSVDSSVAQGADEIPVSVEQAGDLTAVKLGNKILKWNVVNESAIRLLNLRADGVTKDQATREIAFEFKGGAKAMVRFDVVAPAACPEALSIGNVTVQPSNETDSTVRVELTTKMAQHTDQLLLEIGGKVFGLRDTPVRRESREEGPILTATVPTALLISNPRVRVFRPFWSDMDGDGLHCYDTSFALTGFDPDSATERLVLVSLDADGNAVYLLYGNGLEDAKLLMPDKDATLESVDNVTAGRIRLLKIKKSALQITKKIVLQKEDTQRPLLLDLPDVKSTPPKVNVDSPVIQNTNELDVSAEQAADVAAIKLDDKKLQWKLIDKSTIRLLNLKADGVTNEQKTRKITIEYKNGVKAALKFEVVAARIGVK